MMHLLIRTAAPCHPVTRSLAVALFILGAVLSTSASANPQATASEDAPALARRVCVACHGPAGRATSPLFPHLAGQPAAYLATELRAFKSHQRDEPEARDYMWGIAGSLSDDAIDALAQYYAQQAPLAGGSAGVALAKAGEQLYREGDPVRGIPACASCHGANGEGTAQFPRIAGQQGSYLKRQMQEIQHGQRPAPTMKGVIGSMDGNQIDALTAFLSGQQP